MTKTSTAELIEQPVLSIEGNYLLFADPPWEVAARLDVTYYLEVPPAVRTDRLLPRHRLGYGSGAAAWVERVDRPNSVIVEATRCRADFVVRSVDVGNGVDMDVDTDPLP